MLQAEDADDFLLATGKATTAREFTAAAFAAGGIPIEFSGSETDEIGRRHDNGEVVVKVSPRFYRPVDSGNLRGDASKAKERLGWVAETHATQLAQMMVAADRALRKGERE